MFKMSNPKWCWDQWNAGYGI